MSLTFVKRSALPILQKGKEGSDSVMVSVNGTITFSSKITKFLNLKAEQKAKCGLAYDTDSRKVVFLPETHPLCVKALKTDPNALFDVRVSKSTQATISSGVGFLKFTVQDYDYKASGNQSFAVERNEKDNTVSFVLPKGALQARPKVERKKKNKSEGTRAEVSSTSAVKPNDDDELVLESA